jgi:hypothetical protein
MLTLQVDYYTIVALFRFTSFLELVFGYRF